jgi:tetratricopeptide (TPR) repeat protein
MQLGRTREAENLFDRAIDLLRSGAGTETPSLAAVLHNLGNLYEATGRPNEARQLQEQAAAMLAKIFGPGRAPFMPAAMLPVWQDL